jgi:hypothetical protein
VAKYESVNGAWPAGTRDGRDLKPTPQEAIAGFRRLFRKAFGRPYRGKLILTSGSRRTWYGSKPRTIRVNPDERGGGWHEIVHSVSHMASRELYREGHGPRHAFIERELIKLVVDGGWLEGKLRRDPKPAAEINPVQTRRNATLASIARWTTKAKRADTALRKLRRRLRYYDRKLAA